MQEEQCTGAAPDDLLSPAIRFRGVTKRYGQRMVLRDLSLDVDVGCYFGLVGVNGVGKTTCIKALLDFTAIDAGSIEIFGTDHRETQARRGLSFLPERFLPPYYLTGWDFLRYTASLDRRRLDPGAAAEMCQTLDFDVEALDRSVREFSKGMGQKLGLCASFLHRKPLLVLDEPMSGLDPKARLLVKSYLKRLKGSGVTVFFSTHMLADVDDLCDRMGILHAGELRYIGSPAACREQFEQASLEAAYLACISQ